MNAVRQRLSSWTGGWNPYNPEDLERSNRRGLEPVAVTEAPVMALAVKVVVASFAAFTAWAFMAPLDAGVVVHGSVTVSGYRKAVQYPTGGVVQKLMVKEGDHVRQGDVLLRVNPLSSEANLVSAELQYINLLATESRLLSERAHGAEIRWKPELEAFGPSDPRATEAKLVQMQLFRSRSLELESQGRVLREQLAAQEAQLNGQTKLLGEKRKQLELIVHEARNTAQLAKEGYVPESSANSLLRMQSSLEGEILGATAQISSIQSTMSAVREQIQQQRNAFQRDIDAQLTETQKTREADLRKLEALKFERSLTEVRAPASGTVIGLKINTEGGVIGAGQILMEIVPEGSHLVVDAEVPVAEIDKVRKGMDTDLRFSAFNQRITPVVPGVVHLVGADKLSNPKGEEYYLAQIETTPEGLSLLGKHQIQPGMPVEVVVKAGERSFIEYLMKPLSDRFARSFKEN